MKAALTPLEMVKAAYFYYVRGLDQATITEMLEVKNVGRVNEAIKKIGSAVGLTTPGYKDDDRWGA